MSRSKRTHPPGAAPSRPQPPAGEAPRPQPPPAEPPTTAVSGQYPLPAPHSWAPGLTYHDLQRAIFLTFGLVLVYQLAGPLTTLLLFFLLVFILAAVVNAVASRLERRGVPRFVSAAGVVVLLLGLVVALGWLALPPLAGELKHFFETYDTREAQLRQSYQAFVQRFPQAAGMFPSPDELSRTMAPQLSRLAGALGRYTLNAAVGLMSMVLLLVLVIYAVAHPVPLVAGLLSATPDRYRAQMETTLRRILEQLQSWAIGSLTLGVIVGVMCGVGLKLIGVEYALLFGVIAGVGEMIPNIGPILSAVPPALFVLTRDPVQALWVVLLYVAVQQLENNLIVPLVMGQSLKLHPLSVTFTVLVMGALFGLLGAILAVPVCAILKVFWEEFYLKPRQTDVEALETVAADIVSGGRR